MTDQPSDEMLLGELRRLAKRVDPIPDEVTAYARAALGWRRVDAELAELLDDSRLAMGAARGPAGPRTLTFRATGLEIAVELTEEDDQIRVLGQIAPAAVVEVELQRDDGSNVTTAVSDELGRFRVDLATHMRLRLIVRRAGATVVQTSWFEL